MRTARSAGNRSYNFAMARASWCCFAMLLTLGLWADAQATRTGLPKQLTIARHTFIDFGPPNDFYEIIRVDQTGKGLHVQRVSVTPPGMVCVQPAKVEYSSGVLRETMSDLLRGQNPCSIPAKALRQERKRCKHCMVFSGADITLQLQCGSAQRRIDMDVLDRDRFDANPGTPKCTSWTMGVLQQLDSVLGPGVLDQSMFSMGAPKTPSVPENQFIRGLRSGAFDGLFGTNSFGKPVRVSRIALDAERTFPVPTVEVVSAEPARPAPSPLPNYPPIARLARVEGLVRATFEINGRGQVQEIAFPDGPKLGMLQTAVKAALQEWKFAPSADSKSGSVSILFNLNCNPADWASAATN
jgi:TonB family protein